MSRSLYFALDMLEEMSHNNEDEKNTSTTKVKFIIQIVFFTLSIQTKPPFLYLSVSCSAASEHMDPCEGLTCAVCSQWRSL